MEHGRRSGHGHGRRSQTSIATNGNAPTSIATSRTFSSSTATSASRTPSAPRARAAKARVAASRQSREARVRDPRGVVPDDGGTQRHSEAISHVQARVRDLGGVVPDDGGTQRHSAMYPNVSNNLVSGALRGNQPYTQKSRAWRPRQRTRASLPHTARSCWAALCRLTSSATQKTEEATIKERFGQ